MAELTQNANSYEMTHTLTYYECTDNGHPSMSMLLSMMTMSSDVHSIFVGLDRDAIEQSGGAWVVIGYEGEFSPEQPSVGDEVILGTRAIEYNSFFALREFWLTDLDHKHEYARIKAMFVMMNLEKRRLMRIPNELITPYKSTLNKRLAQLKAPSKLPDDFQEKEYQVRYFDIDLNHHVNNARYFDWMLDPLGAEFLRTHYPAYLTIKYENEVKEESTVQSRVHIDRDGDQVKTIHEIWSHGELCTMAEMTWNHI